MIYATGVVVVVPKRPAATGDYAARFIKSAEADGIFRLSHDAAGFTQEKVAR
ncbi:MAG TPA: hypothetical protein VHR44_01660 [Beijerinckiaceae bacterium]|nr:hypothetical protein [Beijerinckiaceae bacterium]